MTGKRTYSRPVPVPRPCGCGARGRHKASCTRVPLYRRFENPENKSC